MIRNTHHDICNTHHIRCDNCFFSVWIINPNRPLLICKQRQGRLGRWWGVLLDDKCSNFYPSGTFKQGSTAVRRIPLTQGKFATVDAKDYYRLAQFQWFAEFGGRTFYAVRKQNGKSIKMHRYIMSAPSHLVVDHIDHNGLNNCRANLRLCSFAQNMRNVVSNVGATSTYKGVHWNKRMKRWAASIQFEKKQYHLGYFTDETEAAKAYDKKASQLHRQFACLNFPPVASKL